MSSLTFCDRAILDCLDKYGPLAPKEICQKTGIAYKTLYGSKNYMGELKSKGLVHISEWRRQSGHGGPPNPIWAIGDGEDAIKPVPLPNTVTCRHYRIRSRKPKSIIASVLGVRSAACR